jgi:hypothetical protein
VITVLAAPLGGLRGADSGFLGIANSKLTALGRPLGVNARMNLLWGFVIVQNHCSGEMNPLAPRVAPEVVSCMSGSKALPVRIKSAFPEGTRWFAYPWRALTLALRAVVRSTTCNDRLSDQRPADCTRLIFPAVDAMTILERAAAAASVNVI